MNIYLIDKKEDLGDTLKILKPYGRIVLLDSGEKEVSKYKELYEDEEEKVIGIAPGVTEWSFPLEDLKKIKNLKGICTKSSWAFYIDVEYCKKNGRRTKPRNEKTKIQNHRPTRKRMCLLRKSIYS